MDSLVWFAAWACVAFPLWLIVFGVYYLCGVLLKYFMPTNRKGVRDDFSRN